MQLLKEQKTMIKEIGVTLITTTVIGLVTWAYHIDKRVDNNAMSVHILLTPDGDIRPSVKVEVLEERIRLHKHE